MAEKASSGNKDHTPREYQLELLESAKKKNIIVCLGTGTGKTFISIKLIEYLARKHDIIRPFSEGAKRTFFLVNSVPLVFQQAEAIKKHSFLKVEGFCGEMGVDFWSKNDWMKHFEENHVLVMTHQIYFDLLQHARIELRRANLLVFDECHHATKNHPFKRIMDRVADFPIKHQPRILGLTASVVGQKVKPFQIPSKVRELERTMRCTCETASDPNVVEKYGAKPEEFIERYSSSSHSDPVANYLEQEMRLALNDLQKFLSDVKIIQEVNGAQEVLEKELSVLKSAMRECLAALDEIGVWAAYEISKMLVNDLEKRNKRIRAGLSPKARLASLFLEATLTTLRKVGGIYNEFNMANLSAGSMQQEFLKPKVKKLLELCKKRQGNADICSIIFVERRYAACVVSMLINQMADHDNNYRHLSSNFVTGHGADLKGISDTEMKFVEQKRVLQDFRNGKFNVLVGTSVVEEGVDIPKCNLVVMFDYPKNYRAYVQSRGRGRAKDAKYVLLVERKEYEERKHEQEMYQGIDDYLSNLCKDRALPTDEESNEVVNVDLLEPYMTKIGAKVDMGSAIGLVHRYCSKLPCDRFTQLKPKFTINDIGEEYQCTLQLPRNCPITGLIHGEPMPSKEEAKKAVALEACIQLHERGELNDNLLPTGCSSDSDSEDDDVDVDEADGSKAKTGTKKRQRPHEIQVARQLEERLNTGHNEMAYVYAIRMKVTSVFPSKKSKTKKTLWDRKKRLFGLVTKSRLPELEPSYFTLYHDIGEVMITLEPCLELSGLEQGHLGLINWFHDFIFREALQCNGLKNQTGCRVVLLNYTDRNFQPLSTKRPYFPAEVIGIDYEEMVNLAEQTSQWNGKISPDTDLEDSVVAAEYRDNTANHLVTTVDRDMNPCSEFPDKSKGKTFKEYFKNRYGEIIKDDQQPLIQVVYFSRNIDCRSRRNIISMETRYDKERLVPELCTLRKCPQSILLRACLLPSVLYRVQSLLTIHELRNTIAKEAGIGRMDFPLKKSKISDWSNGDGRMSDSSTDDEDISDGPENAFLSTVDKYFQPFDMSKSVPLLSLLEAVTCTSSRDSFDLERLEMLGDSFLKMVVSIHVYWHKEHKDEGKLTKYRSKQISNKNLFNLAVRKEIPGYVKYTVLSRTSWNPPGYTDGDENGVKQKISDKSIADSVEALIGAHLTECGYMTTLKFMKWLGLNVMSEEREHGRRSHYANYPTPTFEIPEGEEKSRYREVLEQQTKEMAPFEQKIGYVFKNKVLLLEALTHPTFSDQVITGSYERLEFLGDAILDFLVTQHIYNRCGEKLTPGKLTDLRSALVNNNIFAMIAVENDYHRYLKQYSPELFTNIGRFVTACQEYREEFPNEVNPDPYVIPVRYDTDGTECIEAPKPLGDVFESVAGAIFLDSGLNVKKVWEVYYPMLKKFIDAYSKDVPLNPVREVYQFDSGVEFGHAKKREDGRVSCDLTLTKEKSGNIGQQVFTGVGRNKHNAKLSAAHKARERIRETNNN